MPSSALIVIVQCKQFWSLILVTPLDILNTSIKSCRFLLSSSGHKFKLCNLSS